MSSEIVLDALHERRERVFLILAGFFLCAMTLLNVIGLTRFVQLGPLAVAVGVLPYPITFLCTDLISELYGKRRANFLVTVGLILNAFILLVMWVGQALPATDPAAPWQVLELAESVFLPNGEQKQGSVELFSLMYACTSGAVVASMIAYVAAQYCDVHLFHFWKKLTKGKHLWLRNNFSTLVSQAVDSFIVISVTFGAAFMRGEQTLIVLLGLMWYNYAFKMLSAMADTLPLYFLVGKLRRYLEIPETIPENS